MSDYQSKVLTRIDGIENGSQSPDGSEILKPKPTMVVYSEKSSSDRHTEMGKTLFSLYFFYLKLALNSKCRKDIYDF